MAPSKAKSILPIRVSRSGDESRQDSDSESEQENLRNKKPSKIPTATIRRGRETQSDSSADESKRKSNNQQKPNSGISFEYDQHKEGRNFLKKTVRKVLRSVTPTRQKKTVCAPSNVETKVVTTSMKAKHASSSHLPNETAQNIKNIQKPAPRDTKTSFLRKKLQSERKLSTNECDKKKTKSGATAPRSITDQRGQKQNLSVEDQKKNDSEFGSDLVQELSDQEELKNEPVSLARAVKKTPSYRPKRALEGLTNRREETRKCRDAVQDLEEEWAESDLVKPLSVDIDLISLNHGNNGYDTDDDDINDQKELPCDVIDENNLVMSLEDTKVSDETIAKEKIGRQRESPASPRDTCPTMETFLEKRRQMFANHSVKDIEEDEDSPSDWVNSGFSSEDDEVGNLQPKQSNKGVAAGSNAVKKGSETKESRKHKSSPQGMAVREAPHREGQTEARRDLGINYGEIYEDWDDSSSEGSKTPSLDLSVQKEICSNSKENQGSSSTRGIDLLRARVANEVVEEGHTRINRADHANIQTNDPEGYNDWDDSSSESFQNLKPCLDHSAEKTGPLDNGDQVLPTATSVGLLGACAVDEAAKEEHGQTNLPERYDDWDDSSLESLQNLKPCLDPSAEKTGPLDNGDQVLPTTTNAGFLGACAVDEAAKEEHGQTNLPERYDDWDDSSSESLRTPSLNFSEENETVSHGKEINVVPATCSVGALDACPAGEADDEQQARTNQLDCEPILAKCPERYNDWDDSSSESAGKPLLDASAEKKTGPPRNRNQVITTESFPVTCAADEIAVREQRSHENDQTSRLPQGFDDWDDSSSEAVQTPSLNLSEEENTEFHASKTQMPRFTWNVSSLDACATDDVPKDEQARTHRDAKMNDSERYDDSGDSSTKSLRTLAVDLSREETGSNISRYQMTPRLCNEDSFKARAVDVVAENEETRTNLLVTDTEQIQTNLPERYNDSNRLQNQSSNKVRTPSPHSSDEKDNGSKANKCQSQPTICTWEILDENADKHVVDDEQSREGNQTDDQQAQAIVSECYDDWDDSASESVRTPSLNVSGETTGCHMKRQVLSTVWNPGSTDARTAEEAGDDEKDHAISVDDKQAKQVEHNHELDASKWESVPTLSLELAGENSGCHINKDVVIPSTCNAGSSHSYTANDAEEQAKIKPPELYDDRDDSSSNSAGTLSSDTDISFFGEENTGLIINENQVQPPACSVGSLGTRGAEEETVCGQHKTRKHRELEVAVIHTALESSPNKEGQNRSEQVAASSLNQDSQHACVPSKEQTDSLDDQNIFENSAERRKAHVSGDLLPRKNGDAEDTKKTPLLAQADINADINAESIKEEHGAETTANRPRFDGETTGNAKSEEKAFGGKVVHSLDKEFSTVSLHQGEGYAKSNRETPKKDCIDQETITGKTSHTADMEEGKCLPNSSPSNGDEIAGKQDKEAVAVANRCKDGAQTVSENPALHNGSHQTDVNAMKKEYLAALNKQLVEIKSLTKENKKLKRLLKEASTQESPLIKNLEEQIKQLRLQTDEMGEEKSALKSLIKSTMLQKDKFGQQVDGLQRELNNARTENKKLKVDLDAMVSEVNNQRSEEENDYCQALDEKDCQIKSLKEEIQSLKATLEEGNQQRKKDEYRAKSLKSEMKKLFHRTRDLEKKLQICSSEKKIFEDELEATNLTVSKRSSGKTELKYKETEFSNMQNVTKSAVTQGGKFDSNQDATKRDKEQLGDEISFMWKSLNERQASRRQLERQAKQLQKELLVYTEGKASTDQGFDYTQGDKEIPGVWDLIDKKNARIDALKRDLEEKEQHVSEIHVSLGDMVAKIKQLQTDLDDATMEKSKLLDEKKGMIRDLEQAKRTAGEATQFKNYYMQKVLDEVALLDDQVRLDDDEKEIKQPLNEERKKVNSVSAFMIRLKRDIQRLSVSVQEKDKKLQKGRIAAFFKERELHDVKSKLGEAENMLQEWKALSKDRERSLKEVNHSLKENAKILEAMSRQQRKDLRDLRASAKRKDGELKRVRNAFEESRKEVESVKSLLAEKEGLIAGLEKKVNDIEFIAYKMNGKLRKKMEGNKLFLTLKELNDVKRENMKLSSNNAEIEKRLEEMETKASDDHKDLIKKINNALEHVRLQREEIRLLNGKLEESRNDELCGWDSLKKISGVHTPHNGSVILKACHSKKN